MNSPPTVTKAKLTPRSILWLIFAFSLITPLAARDSVVVFNELHYHPENDDSTLEYVELYNQLAIDVDISNWRFDGDIEFNFPEGTVIGGQEYLVIAKDPAALAAATGFNSALGPFLGFLSNSGDPVILYKNNQAFNTLGGVSGSASESLQERRIMDVLDYADVAPWPIAPDGSGFTLSKIEPNTGTAQAEHWTTSSEPLGTPGSANTFNTTDPLAFNEVTGSLEAIFQLEIYNHGTLPLSLNALVITSPDPLHADYVFPSSTLNAGDFLTLSESDLGYRPDDNERLFLMTSGKNAIIDTVRVDDRSKARSPDGEGDWLRPSTATFGSLNAVTLRDEIVVNEIFYHAPSQRSVPAITANITVTDVIDFDDSWRYNLDAGAAGLLANWAASSHSVDGVSWAEGPGLLGVENTTLGEPLRTTMSLTSQLTYYFERDFTYDGIDSVTDLVFNHYTDDGAVFYLNGVEIERFNMEDGAFNAATLATPAVGNASLQNFVLSSPNLITGLNRLSVEVHQTSNNSSDVVFGAKVQLRTAQSEPGSPYAEQDEEWIELYNRSASPVDLSDWRLGGGINYQFPPGTIISAQGYLVIAEDSAALATKHPAANIIGDYGGKLANGGELLVLEDAVGNPADEVRYYDSKKWHSKADGNGSSLELRNPDSDNSVAGSWAPSDEADRNSWQTYSYEGIAIDDGVGPSTFHELQIGLLDSGEFLIDEVSVIEENSLELIQNGDFQSDSVGSLADKWRTIGTHGSHGNTIVVTDPDDAGNKCLHVVSTGATENKHNKIETTFTNNEEIVPGNFYRISFRAKHLSGSNQLNSRLYFNYLQRTSILEAATIWGTPGLPNSIAEANAGPTLSGLSHSPVVPDANQAVTVSITANDPDGIGSVALKYSVNAGAFQTTAMTLAADGRYSGSIPGQAASALVQFYIEATDGSTTRFFPESAENSGAFYKVQDGFADTTGLRHNLRILMSDSDYSWLLERVNKLSDDRLPVTIIENEETVYYDASARLKGSPVGRNGNTDHEYVIAFQPDQLFRGVHSGIAVERSNLGQQLFSKHLNNRSGTAYTSAYDDVSYIIPPDGGDRGMGLLFTARNTGTFFESLHPENSGEGTLFNLELLYSPTTTSDGDPESWKLLRPSTLEGGKYDLKSYGPDKETIRWGFEIRSARDRDDYSPIIAMNEAFALNGEAFANALEQVADIDQWMRVFALMTLNGTDDVFSRLFEHNFRFYVRPDGLIVVMQWDLDRAFRLSTSDATTILPTLNIDGDSAAAAKLFTIPRFERLFHGHIRDLIDTTFNQTYLASWATELTSVSGVNMNTISNYVGNRANLVDNVLPANIPFEITSNGGEDFSVMGSSSELEGDAWVDVVSIEIDGIETPITWTDADSWLITAPLSIGVNSLTLTAFNHNGVAVGSDTITLTNTSNVDLANAGNSLISELHYHPALPSTAETAAGHGVDNDFEFIELVNTSSSFVDYTNVTFTNGLTFTMPVGTVLAPGERVVLVADQAAFEFRYGLSFVRIVGEYTGSLSNSGERIRLAAADGSTIADFTYSDTDPWPEESDGDGYSLVLRGDDATLPIDWRLSTAFDGNPGSTDSIPFTGASLIDYLLADCPTLIPNADSIFFQFSLNRGADDATFEVQFSKDLDLWTPASPAEFFSRVINPDGTTTYLYEALNPLEAEDSYFGRIKVLSP